MRQTSASIFLLCATLALMSGILSEARYFSYFFLFFYVIFYITTPSSQVQMVFLPLLAITRIIYLHYYLVKFNFGTGDQLSHKFIIKNDWALRAILPFFGKIAYSFSEQTLTLTSHHSYDDLEKFIESFDFRIQ